jgi:hypothetical protein
MLEEAASVLSTESRDRLAHRLEKCLSATGLGFVHQAGRNIIVLTGASGRL